MCNRTSPTFTTCRDSLVSQPSYDHCTHSITSTRPRSPPTKRLVVFSPRRWHRYRLLRRRCLSQRSPWRVIMMIILSTLPSILQSTPLSTPQSILHQYSPFPQPLPAIPSDGDLSSASSSFVWAFRSWQPMRFFFSHFYSRRNSPRKTRNVVPRQPQDIVCGNGCEKQHRL